MGWGKILGMAALGVGAVAAAPFTGGGSILAATGAVASLAGAGTVAVAVGAGVVGAGVGAVISDNEEKEEARQQTAITKANLKADKAETIVEETKEHYTLIIALTALGVSMANVDGKISPEEMEELHEFVGGLASQKYPQHIIEEIDNIVKNPPTFNEAMKHFEKVSSVEYPEIRNILVAVMKSDGEIHQKEKAFLSAYDLHVGELQKESL